MRSTAPKRNKIPIWKDRYKTVGAIIAAGGDVKQLCGHCSGAFKVDLNLLTKALGENADIRGTRFDCPAYGCKGTTTLLVRNGVYRPL